MEAFSLAVRRRIIELFRSGLEGDVVACSPAAARRIWQRYREEGLVGRVRTPADTRRSSTMSRKSRCWRS
jgi:hypothetical protein